MQCLKLRNITDLFRARIYRDSELTDYDISDFHRDENHEHGAPIANAHFIALEAAQPTVEANFPAPVDSATRHTTGDSDEYVKVHADPIYDMPPRGEKAMSPEEAKQLQELCQEYDFGMDMGPDGPTPPQSFPINSQFSPPAFQSATHQAPRFVPQEIPQEAPRPPPRQIIRDAQRLQTGEVSENNDKNVHKVPIKLLRLENAESEDPKNIVNAEMYVSDALEYLGNQQAHSPTGAFVMEEDMLSSHGSQKRPEQYVRLPSGDPTSHQIKTMEVFERVEHDDHDDITYAPEIQSVEIPPDQMSENSENLQEYFDRAAAEGALEAKLREMKPISAQQAARGQAPHIVSASGNRANSNSSLASGRSGRSSSDGFPKLRKQSSLLSVMGVTSMQEILLTIDSLDTLSDAMRKAGLENTNMIFGIDYTASNKYQGEDSFGGRSLHTIHPNIMNPYQQVITILGRTLAPFASTGCIPLYGFGDAKTGDWSVFPLKQDGDCRTLEEVLKIYNEVTPTVDLSGPTNFAPLIYQAMEICQKANDYHILVIIADGQVTNERATRRAIVQACQYPLSIIVVGVGDGPWEMMRVFDESLPKRPWDNFHFTEFHEIMRRASGQAEGDVKLAVQSLLEIPDQYRCICELGLLKNRSIPPRGSEIRKEILSK
ncbi:VWFA domain-containing protein [Trichostrongylus colubriformis]|uniref:VWFA domain-containing protein n=1 Tax=Trichostrongylus colubriformis TaxID=6319 RepID=A0AAN8ET05_TRICO